MAVDSMLNETEKMRFLFCGHEVIELQIKGLKEIKSFGREGLMLHNQHRTVGAMHYIVADAAQQQFR